MDSKNDEERWKLRVLLILSSERHLRSSRTFSEDTNSEHASQLTRNSKCSSSDIIADSGVSLSYLEDIVTQLAAQKIAVIIATPTGHHAALSDADTAMLTAKLEGLSNAKRSGMNPPPVEFDGKKDVDCTIHLSSGSQKQNLYEHLLSPIALRECAVDTFDGLLIPHHIGAAIELISSCGVGKTLAAFQRSGRPICAIGFGVFALLAKRPIMESPLAERESGKFDLSTAPRANNFESHGRRSGFLSEAGRSFSFPSFRLTGVSVEDEVRYPFFGHLPSILQEQLENEGGIFLSFPTDSPGCVIDRNLVSGSNELSTEICVQNLCFLCHRRLQNTNGQ